MDAFDTSFDPANWFWIVGDDTSRAWSSASGDYVQAWPEDRVTVVADETQLDAVLRHLGQASPIADVGDYRAAIQAHIDAMAASKAYNDAVTLAGYVASTNALWAAEAAAFLGWRDAVWAYAYGELAKVQDGSRAQPSVQALVAELPDIAWPSSP